MSKRLIILKEINKDKELPYGYDNYNSSFEDCTWIQFNIIGFVCPPLGSILILIIYLKHITFACIIPLISHIAITFLSIVSICYFASSGEDNGSYFVLGVPCLILLGIFGSPCVVAVAFRVI